MDKMLNLQHSNANAPRVFSERVSFSPPPLFQSSRAFRNWALQEQSGYLHDCYDCCCDLLLQRLVVVVGENHHHHLCKCNLHTEVSP